MIPISKPSIDEREIQQVTKVISNGQLAQGDNVYAFEEAFADHFDYKYSAATSNGTAGLHVALKAAGVKTGDIVLTTPFSFIATTNAIIYCGAIPVFIDIDDKTFNISPEKLREKLIEYPNVKYLLIVHLFGQPCQMDEIMDLVVSKELILIEDCCQAHGATFQEKTVGSFGHVSVFSFYPTKNMTTGEGGMIVTHSRELFEKCKLLINHGSKKKYMHEVTGYNYRMTEMAAAIGLEQLKKLNSMNLKRRSNAEFYKKHISNEFIQLPFNRENIEHVYNAFTIMTEYRDELIEYLSLKQIGTSIYYPLSINLQDSVQDYLSAMNETVSHCPISGMVSKKVLSIPMYPGLTEPELKYISETVSSFIPRAVLTK
ncbi:DegT/DnrJ/EryC1/StrS family aminotransferase [Paenibacillus tritici]|uniref:DegT/DnrJ/EryC1/StrS family aminotransferase n=1 Tax=Paenibacillus tritici TaxID=1873425 RepID=UPI001BAC99B8|nr:DegT/DnrJ/EryC1/StrS family aminotransferase [Paenibacillus tritici]QUL57076.1 DegT/DnrJ/EryC1/StrS family aminotransferase [Paenibacillus tritici]